MPGQAVRFNRLVDCALRAWCSGARSFFIPPLPPFPLRIALRPGDSPPRRHERPVLMPRNHLRRLPLIALALSCAVMVAGCATWQGPRIDPTGERFFVWPGDPPPIVAPPTTFAPGPVVGPPPGATIVSPPPSSTVIAPPPGATVVGPPPAVSAMQPLPQVVPSTPFGNVMAPPVYSDPPGMVATTPFVGPATPVPAIPTTPPGSPLPQPPLPAPPIAAVPTLPPPPPIGAPIMAPPTPVAPAAASTYESVPTV